MEAVRPATTEDLPAVAELVRAGIAELQPMRGGAVWAAQEARREPIEQDLARLLEAEDCRFVVGTIDDVVVGYAVAHLERLGDGSLLGVVDEIFVDLEARGVGLGEVMMDDLVSWCRSSGCFGMDAIALPGHRLTKNFFEESGFTARKIVMHHQLTPDGDPGEDGAGRER